MKKIIVILLLTILLSSCEYEPPKGAKLIYENVELDIQLYQTSPLDCLVESPYMYQSDYTSYYLDGCYPDADYLIVKDGKEYTLEELLQKEWLTDIELLSIPFKTSFLINYHPYESILIHNYKVVENIIDEQGGHTIGYTEIDLKVYANYTENKEFMNYSYSYFTEIPDAQMNFLVVFICDETEGNVNEGFGVSPTNHLNEGTILLDLEKCNEDLSYQYHVSEMFSTRKILNLDLTYEEHKEIESRIFIE